MNWHLHDEYKTKKYAMNYGKLIFESGLSRGAKVVKKIIKSVRPFSLYILPLRNVKGKNV